MTQAALQFYVLDSDSVEEIQEDWINKMFEASGGAAGSSSDSSDEKPRKSKKGKKAHGKKKNPKAHYISDHDHHNPQPQSVHATLQASGKKDPNITKAKKAFGLCNYFPNHPQ